MKKSILQRHPQTIMGRVRPDGSVKPFTVEEQWKQVADWHRFLQESEEDENYDSMDSYLEAWEALEGAGVTADQRGLDIQLFSSSPLSALFSLVEEGLYPPPELLLALLDCWNTYAHASGGVTLEEAFLGKPVQKAGNFAQRKSAKFKKVFITFQFANLVRQGMSREDAAVKVSEMVGGKPEAESVLRMARGLKPTPKLQK